MANTVPHYYNIYAVVVVVVIVLIYYNCYYVVQITSGLRRLMLTRRLLEVFTKRFAAVYKLELTT